LKERLHLEGLLPIDENSDEDKEALYKKLDYNIADSKPATKKVLAEYALYHQEYPNFIRVSM
jgi:hypothetical protein